MHERAGGVRRHSAGRSVAVGWMGGMIGLAGGRGRGEGRGLDRSLQWQFHCSNCKQSIPAQLIVPNPAAAPPPVLDATTKAQADVTDHLQAAG